MRTAQTHIHPTASPLHVPETLLMVIALAGVAVELATVPLFNALLPRQWLGVHVILFGVWLIAWAISTRARNQPSAVVVAVTLTITVLPVFGWLAFTDG
ncbi:MAG: hypothetical protein EBR82_31765 [Caulobacteraceae bacterium]|nr:hypothetical protein [Caulobacteraceae bacterium]